MSEQLPIGERCGTEMSTLTFCAKQRGHEGRHATFTQLRIDTLERERDELGQEAATWKVKYEQVERRNAEAHDRNSPSCPYRAEAAAWQRNALKWEAELELANAEAEGAHKGRAEASVAKVEAEQRAERAEAALREAGASLALAETVQNGKAWRHVADASTRIHRALTEHPSDPGENECGKPTVQAGTDGFCTRPQGHSGSCVTVY